LAVRIRLRRTGAKNAPQYRLVVTDVRAKRDGRFIETLGYYDPKADPAVSEVNEERALYWLSQGAVPSETAKRLLSKAGILKKFAESKTTG
jgi:small subunit ribosomal protein S16